MRLFCKHKWIEKERHLITKVYYTGGEVPDCILIVQECEKCGKLKKVNLP